MRVTNSTLLCSHSKDISWGVTTPSTYIQMSREKGMSLFSGPLRRNRDNVELSPTTLYFGKENGKLTSTIDKTPTSPIEGLSPYKYFHKNRRLSIINLNTLPLTLTS